MPEQSRIAWKQTPPPDATNLCWPLGAARIRSRVGRDESLSFEHRLQPAMQSVFFPATPDNVRGICILRHGATAGPYQFWELGRRLSAAGFHAYAPRLPGHGYAKSDGTPDATQLPKSTDYRRYFEAAQFELDAAYELSQTANVPIVAIGFSAGALGTLYNVAEQGERLAGFALVAPYLAVKPIGPRLLFSALRRVDKYGALGLGLDHLHHAWSAAERPNAEAWGRPGHWEFHKGTIWALELAKKHVLGMLLDGLGSHQLHVPPMLLALTAEDRVVSNSKALWLFRLLGGRQKGHTLVQFGAMSNIPHAMLSSMENRDDAARERLHTSLIEFVIERARLWCEGHKR